MIDTVVLESPELSEEVACFVEAFCEYRSCVEKRTGIVLWDFITGSLAGSHDHRISVKVKRERFEGKVLIPCPPYIRIEASLHKAMLDHNIHGGPLDPVAACCWFVDETSRRLSNCPLPSGLLWSVGRIDWAEVFNLGSNGGVVKFLAGIACAKYPRRKSTVIYTGQSVTFPGTVTTLKFYNKLKELEAHDCKRWMKHAPESYIVTRKMEAEGCLRVETTIKREKLSADFGRVPFVSELSMEYLQEIHDLGVSRVLQEADSAMIVVSNSDEVQARLNECYPGNSLLAGCLYGTWSKLALHGEKSIKPTMKEATFYRHKRQLKEAGCSWLNTDVVRLDSSHSPIPAGFSPVRSDPRRLTTESPEVEQALSPYRLPAPKV